MKIEVGNKNTENGLLGYILTDPEFKILSYQTFKNNTILGVKKKSSLLGKHIKIIKIFKDINFQVLIDLIKTHSEQIFEVHESIEGWGDVVIQVRPLTNGLENSNYLFEISSRNNYKTKEYEDFISGISQFDKIFNTANDIIFLKNKNFQFIYVNDAFCRFYNLSKEEIIGKTDFDLIPSEIAHKYRVLDQEAFERETLTITDEANFGGRTMEYKKFIVRSASGEPYIAGVARDVTYWRQIISNLEEKQKELEFFFNNNIFGAFIARCAEPVLWSSIKNKDAFYEEFVKTTKVTRVNQKFLEHYGATTEQLIGYSILDFFGTDIEQAKNTAKAFFEGGEHLKAITYEKKVDGSDIIIEGEYSAFYNENGYMTGFWGIQDEVTEKIIKKEKLQAYQNLLEESFRVAKMGGWEVDMNTGVLSWTKSSYEIFELTENYVPSMDNIYRLVAFEEDRKVIKSKIKTSLITGDRFDFDVRVLTGKGNIKWVSLSWVPVLENGVYRKVFGIFKDINEEKTKELLFKESQIKFKTILESTPGIIFVLDRKGFILFISKNVSNSLGYIPEKVLKKQMLSYVLKDDQENIKDIFRDIVKNKVQRETLPHRVKRVDGTYRWMNTSMAPLLDEVGDVEAVLGIAMDITELKETKDALEKTSRQAEQLNIYYRTILENQNIYVIKLDEKNRIVFANILFLKDFWGEYVPEKPSIRKFLDVEDGDVFFNTLESLRRGELKEENLILEIHSYNKDFKRYIQWSLQYYIDNYTEERVIMCIGYDVTELVQSHENTKELLKITEEQNARLRNIAYIISHNIRSHWANMHGIMNILNTTSDVKEKENYLEIIDRAIDNLGITIEDLNNILNIRKELAPPKESVILKDEINLVKETLIHDIVEAGAIIELYMAHNLKLNVVKSYLTSIILNLITNSIKYRSLERPLKVEIHAFKKDGKVVIRHIDNGLGFDMEQVKKKIFGLYKTFHQHPKGRGLGLYIVKTQLETMGGTISVESQPNVGTAFTIVLPED